MLRKKLADFDACSLYPSAMNRMECYLKGTPKVLNSTQLNYNLISERDGYFIKGKMKSIGKFRQFPLLSKYSENGVRIFSND